MYVCICNGFRDGQIRDVARSGARSAHRAYAMLGGEPRCGQCLALAQELIDSVHAGSRGMAAAGGDGDD